VPPVQLALGCCGQTLKQGPKDIRTYREQRRPDAISRLLVSLPAPLLAKLSWAVGIT
jgi:hypothetical protein